MMEEIELRSEKVRNIVGRKPSILIRYGIVIIVAIFAALIIGSFFITCPSDSETTVFEYFMNTIMRK